jgi:hypothetical protein
MPIAAGQSVLQSQIKAALSMDKAANQSAVIGMIIAGLSSVIPMGLVPTAPSPTPLAPAGISGTQSTMNAAINMGPAATIDTTAAMWASAISIAAPMAPPAGMSALQSQIKNAMSMDKAANIDTTAQLIALAIIQYYLAGGIL